MRITITIFLWAILLLTVSIAQIRTNEKPVVLPLFHQFYSTSFSEKIEMRPLSQKEIDSISNKYPNQYIIASGVETSISPSFSGKWTPLLDGRQVWEVEIQSDSAAMLSIAFSRFVLPPEAKLFLYNDSGSLGAYSSENLSADSSFIIQPLPGKELTVQLVVPPYPDFQPDIQINKIYRFFAGYGTQDVSCIPSVKDLDETWQEQINASVMLIFPVGGGAVGLCSGTLINSATATPLPYMLTAAHCTYNGNAVASPYPEQLNNTLIVFNFQQPNYREGQYRNSIPFPPSLRGLSFKAAADDMDFALFELVDFIPIAYSPYYAGWDATGTTPVEATGIHHPDGHDKRYSVMQSGAISSQTARVGLGDGRIKTYSIQGHWQINKWKEGVVENGSSGSALFDENHRIVGDLTGGSSSCGQLLYSDIYQKFSAAWNRHAAPSEQLQYWLDPNNTTGGILDGRYARNVFMASEAQCVGKVFKIGAQRSRFTSYSAQYNSTNVDFYIDTTTQFYTFCFTYPYPQLDTIKIIEYDIFKTPMDTTFFPIMLVDRVSADFSHNSEDVGLVVQTTSPESITYSEWYDEDENLLGSGLTDTLHILGSSPQIITHIAGNDCYSDTVSQTIAAIVYSDFISYPSGYNIDDFLIDTIPFAYQELTVQIYDMQQHIVSEQTYKDNETNIIQIATDHLPPGMYIVYIKSGMGNTINTVIRKILRKNP